MPTHPTCDAQPASRSSRQAPQRPRALRRLWFAGLLLAGAFAPLQAQPAKLSQTGLFTPVAPGAIERLAPGLIAFTPQYALWSDGATKRRWLKLPPGAAIDARDADAWRFPRGTQLWKEFSHGGRAIETRYIEHGRDGRWRFATYAWNAEGTDADLVSTRGEPAWPAPQAPGGRYALPSVADCQACHESNAVPVIGFSALQLSPAREASVTGADLRQLVAQRRLRDLDPALLAMPPRIAASSADERSALGYLHANCGHCHNRSGQQVPLPLTLAQRVRDAAASRAEVLASTLDAPSRFRVPGATAPHDPIVAPGDPARSLLVQRMASRDPRLQMPPLGTAVADLEGLVLVHRWITHDPDLERRARP
ncbi:MAG: hypothetical protein JNN03_01755 [Rubrivivax sp.]|nr:hypothetical protein [Rubrivivax sp.]